MPFTIDYQISRKAYELFVLENGFPPVTQLTFNVLGLPLGTRRRIVNASKMITGTWKPKLSILYRFGVLCKEDAVFNVVHNSIDSLLDELVQMQCSQKLDNLKTSRFLRLKVHERLEALNGELGTSSSKVYLDWPVSQSFMAEKYKHWQNLVDEHNAAVYFRQKELQGKEDTLLLCWALQNGSERLRKLATRYEIGFWRDVAMEEKKGNMV